MPRKVYALRGIFILRALNKKPGDARASEYAFQLLLLESIWHSAKKWIGLCSKKSRGEITEGGSKRGMPACYRSRWPGLAKPSVGLTFFD
jgi:hypothetical protein